MAGEWRMVRLGDVVEINPDVLGADWPYFYIKYIDISSVGHGMIIEPPKLIHRRDAPSRAKRLVRKGDTVLSTVRPNRRAMFYVSDPDPDWVVSTGFAVLRPRTNMIDSRYLYAWIFNKDFTDYLVSREKGAAYPAVLPEDIEDATIKLPPLPEQRAIAHILGTLDDKIELNGRMSETLEQMARAIFKAWFVDFEPVRAKMEGRWRRGESLPGLPAHLYDLFPDRLVDSELGEMPEGWRVGTFGSFTSQRTERVGSREVVVLSAVADGKLVRSDDYFTKRVYSKDIHKYLLVEQWDFAYNPSRINIGSIGMLEDDMLGGVSPVYVVVRPRPAYVWFLEFSLRRSQTRTWINTLASGSVRQSLSYYDFASIPCVLPPAHIAEEFNRRWSVLRDGIRCLKAESRTLAALRDALLPKLIRGEIRVRDAEKFLQERGL